jgi:STIP1 family protein 1
VNKKHSITTMAQALKTKANELFKQGDYVGAEEFYSQA